MWPQGIYSTTKHPNQPYRDYITVTDTAASFLLLFSYRKQNWLNGLKIETNIKDLDRILPLVQLREGKGAKKQFYGLLPFHVGRLFSSKLLKFSTGCIKKNYHSDFDLKSVPGVRFHFF